MFNKKRKKVLCFFGICLIIFLIQSCKIKYPVNTYCVIVKEHIEGPHSGTPFQYGYKVNNNRYISPGINDKRFVVGEKFAMIYDSLHPKRSEIYIKKPVFLEGDSIITVIGTIFELEHWRDKIYGVYFKYSVNNKLLQKYQYLSEETIQIKKGDNFVVRYLYENPQVSIIYIEDPIIKE